MLIRYRSHNQDGLKAARPDCDYEQRQHVVLYVTVVMDHGGYSVTGTSGHTVGKLHQHQAVKRA